eukprot:1238823-Pyramimonas_sp.AAC.1
MAPPSVTSHCIAELHAGREANLRENPLWQGWTHIQPTWLKAEGSGENIPAILRLRSMSNMRTILILSQGHEKMIIPGSEMHRPFLGKGAR